MVISDVPVPDNASDFIRFGVSLLGIFLTGANVAFIVHARSLFPDSAVRFWQLFFIGKAFASALLVAVLFTRQGKAVGWPTILSGISFAIVLYALAMIWLHRPARYLVIRPDLLTKGEREQIVRDLNEPLTRERSTHV